MSADDKQQDQHTTKKRTPATRQRNAVNRALERVAVELEGFDRTLTGAEAAAVVRAVAMRGDTNGY